MTVRNPRVFYSLAVLACAAGCATPQGIEGRAPPPTAAVEELAGLEPHLRPGTVLVLGELHGTVEAPAFVSRAVKLARVKGLPVTVGLEIPREEQPRVRNFLASAGEPRDRAALLAGPFWQSSYQDGRRSEAMAGLLDDLRHYAGAGDHVRVVCFDRQTASVAEREQAMAEALASAIAVAPQDFTIALVGNVHARLARGGVPGNSEPMALRLARLLPETRLLTLELAYSGGTAWVCSSDGGCGIGRFGGHDRDGPAHVTVHETLGRNGFHGVVYAGEITASPPAVEHLRSPPRVEASWTDGAFTAVWEEPDVPSGPRPPVPLVGEWPQWMGPLGDGASEPGLLPHGVSVSLEIDWRRPISRGYSSISVSGGRAVTLEADERGVWALALDVVDGRELWRALLKNPSRSEAERVESPVSTPAITGDRMFAIHPAGLLFALDLEDGGGLWTRDLAQELGASPPSYGMSTSPVLSEGRLVVMAGGGEGYHLIVFDPDSGEVLTALGPAGQGSYSTPVAGLVAGEPQLIVPAGDRLYGVRWNKGESARTEHLWSYGGIPYPDRSPLVLSGGRVFLALQEFAAMFEISSESWTARELWRSKPLRNSYSPAVHYEGSIYGMGGGQLLCLDAATGETRWQAGAGMGSIIRIDDHLAHFGTRSGQLLLVAASPQGFTEVSALAVFPQGDHGATPPSFGAGRIFVRAREEIAAVRLSF